MSKHTRNTSNCSFHTTIIETGMGDADRLSQELMELVCGYLLAIYMRLKIGD